MTVSGIGGSGGKGGAFDATPAWRSAALLAGAGVVYAAVAVVWTWPLATLVGTHTALPAVVRQSLALNDQAFSISAAARNADAIASGDLGRLVDWRLCYPTPHAAALGEHAIELGVLAVPGWLATRDPVVAYNTACLLLIVVAGTSTFLLVRHWTGSPVAAFVGGLAFALHPRQVDDLAHPFVMGIHWIPLLLFALDRLLESGRTRSAALLAVAGALQALVGAYPLVTTIAFVGAYGVTRMVQLRERLDAGRIVRLALATAAVAGAAATVLVQYAGVGAWGVEQRRQMLVPFQNLLPGAPHAIGGTTLGLAALLLVLRGPRRTPVLPVLAGGLACVLLAGGGRLWPGGPVVSGLYPWLAEHVWIFGIVRVPAAIRTGTHLAVALLAALGTARVLDRLGPRPAARLAIGLALSALLMTEYFQPAASSLVYGTSRAVALVPRRPRGDVLDAYRAFDRHGFDGPVVEIPFDHDGRGPVFRMPAYTLLAAYHGRETPACFTSHVPPSYHEVARMVAGVEASPRRAIVELAAAGLRNVVIHHGDAHALFDAVAHAPGVRPLFRSAAASALRIVRPVSPHHDAGRLRPGAVSLGKFEFKGYRHAVLELAIRNAAARVWALPHPVRPLAVRWRYARADGTPVGEWRDGTTMLPLALAGGATATVRVIVTAPPRGCDDCTPEIRIPALAWRVRGR